MPTKIIGILSFLLLIGAVGHWTIQGLTLEAYPGPWQENPHADISETLKSHSVPNCSRYKYRRSSQDKSEYLVHCTSDGSKWSAYIVLAPLRKIAVGPFEPDPAME